MFCWKKLKLSRYLPGPTRAAREQDVNVDLPDRLNGPTVCDSDRRSFLNTLSSFLITWVVMTNGTAITALHTTKRRLLHPK